MTRSPALDIATWLVEQRGCSVIPLDHPDDTNQTDAKRIGKVPRLQTWKVFQQGRPTPDNLRQWFGNGHARNIGIVTGAVSQIVAIDCDSPEAVTWADAHLPATPMATQTARGQHRFYRHPGVPVGNTVRLRADDPAVKIDVRGDGGFVVAPGSVHLSGAAYTRIGTWPPIAEVPEFDPAWLAPPETAAGPGVRPSYTCAEAPRQEAPRETPRQTPDSRARVLTRARAYLAAVPGAIEGQGGDQHTFAVVCAVVRGFDLADSDALDVLREWNARCLPPWTDRELQAKIDGARQYGDEPFGARRDAPRPEPARRAGPTTAGDTAADPRRPYPLTDLGNAEAFADAMRDRVCFDHRRQQFLLFSGHRWQPDETAAVERLAHDLIRQRQRDAHDIPDDAQRQATLKHLMRAESQHSLRALLALAGSLAPLARTGAEWDTDPWVLGVPNGVIDLRTGQLRDGQPADALTKQTGVPFDPAADMTRWEAFIGSTFGPHPDRLPAADSTALVEFVWRYLGYCLTGETGAQCFLLLTGRGANGKSTLLTLIDAVLGDYAATARFETFLGRPSERGEDLAALEGTRFVYASEVADGRRVNDARIKSLTGGEKITCRRLRENFFTYRPAFKLAFACNDLPGVGDQSHGFWRRVRLVPCVHTFAEDPHFEDALKAEAPGILRWLVAGCLAWQRDGLTHPAIVQRATADWRADSDQLGQFLQAATVADSDASVLASDLFKAYVAWCEKEGVPARERVTQTTFGRAMGQRLTRQDRTDGRHYIGRALTPLWRVKPSISA